MGRETKSYMLVEYNRSEERIYDSREQLDEMLRKVKAYNDGKTSKNICGNIDVRYIDGKYYVNFHVYHKFTRKNYISDIDRFIKRFTREELIAYFSPLSAI